MASNIGENIRARRRLRGLSLAELGAAAGVSRQTVQRYESGVITNIPPERVSAMAQALGVSPAALLGWEAAHPAAVTVPCAKEGGAAESDTFLTVPREAAAGAAADFCWRIPNDECAPRFSPGDFALVREQTSVPDGALAVLFFDGKTHLRRVYRTGEGYALVAENPVYPPIVTKEDAIRVIGQVLAVQVAVL